jgi:vacuolar protein-sorting-associated protein 4
VLTAKIRHLNGAATPTAVPRAIPPATRARPEASSSSEASASNDEERSRLQATIAATIVVSKSSTSFSSVVGLEEAKQSLREAIILPSLHPHLFTGMKFLNSKDEIECML